MLRINPARTVSPPARFTAIYRQASPPRLRLAAAVGFNSIVTADLARELEEHKVLPRHGLTFAYTDISAFVAEKDIGLCPVTSAGADYCVASSPTASQVIVTLEERVRGVSSTWLIRSFTSTGTITRGLLTRHTLDNGIFLGFDRRCSCQK